MMPREAVTAAGYTFSMLTVRPIRHCRTCGAPTEYRTPADDNRERAVCTACETIHYENPLNVVGTVPEWDGRVLLCLRNIEPRRGYWTLPAGFMELGETTRQGALRETLEESGALVELGPLFTVLDVPHVGQLHLYFRARMTSDRLDPGPETIEARLFEESEIPWESLAFRTVRFTLERYFDDRRRGQFATHAADIA
jgi:ADP-ribose pyrophosphatase YjhB (NUDIX family)